MSLPAGTCLAARHSASLHAEPTRPQPSSGAGAARWSWQPTRTDKVLQLLRSIWTKPGSIEVATMADHVKIMHKHMPKFQFIRQLNFINNQRLFAFD